MKQGKMKKRFCIFTNLLLTLTMLAGCDTGTGNKPAQKPESVDLLDLQNSTLFYNNADFNEGPFAGDPFIYYEEETGVFYLYGTTRKYTGREAFDYYYSTDLVNWTAGGVCMEPADGDWCTDRLWAPEVYKIDGKYYMYYTAAKGTSGVLHGSVAVSDSPGGPFTNYISEEVNGKKAIFNFGNTFPTIDGSLFIDDNGSMYYYFVRDQIGDNKSSGGTNTTVRSTLWGVELENPYTIKEGAEPVKLTEVGRSTLEESGAYTQKWERQQGLWNEGPFLLKHNGTYYLTYSANFWGSPYYSVGYATSDSPLGTYSKSENAQIMGIEPGNESNWDYFIGTGHAMFLTVGKDNYIVYHTLMPNTDNYRHVTIDSFGFREDGTLYINGPTLSLQPLPSVVNGVANVASDAQITVTNCDENTVQYLTDGEINTTKKYSDYALTTKGGVTEITFSFEEAVPVKAVAVYNSADKATMFTAVNKIQLDTDYEFENIQVLDNSYGTEPGKEQVYAGSAAIMELEQSVSVSQVTIVFDTEQPVQISEIMILAEQA